MINSGPYLPEGCGELAAGEVGGGGGGERGGVAELVQVEVLLYVLRELHPAPSETPRSEPPQKPSQIGIRSRARKP